jgi:dATP pyrophosphohydrolase
VTIRHSIECWVFNQFEEVLLLHVPPAAAEPLGFWQPVTGGIEGNESALEACLREVLEETGILLDAEEVREIANGIAVTITADLTINKTLFRARTDARSVTVSSEHDRHEWVAIEAVAKRLHWPSNRETWRMIAAPPALSA